MEQVIAGVLEKTLIGGAFLFLLYHNNITLSGSLKDISNTLSDVSSTMLRMDMRMEQMEKRIAKLEERDQ